MKHNKSKSWLLHRHLHRNLLSGHISAQYVLCGRMTVQYDVKGVGSTRNRTRDPSHVRQRRRPLSHGDYTVLIYLSWYPWGFSIHYI